MLNKNPWFVVLYLRALEALGRPSVESGEIGQKEIQILGFTSLATNWLVWAYAFVAFFYTSEPLVSELAFVLAFMHTLAPAMLRISSRINFIGSVVLGLLMTQQILLGYFFGGFNGNMLVWYGVVPILAGVLLGFRGVIVWALAVLGTAGSFIFGAFFGYEFPNLLSSEGQMVASFLTVFGWAISVMAIITVFIWQQEEKEEQLRSKNNKINNLLRILTHDVSNSLNVINTASTLFQHYDQDQDRVRYYFEKMDMASANITEVISGVRTLHSAENGWENINLKPTCLGDAVEHCSRLLESRLAEKDISLDLGNLGDKKPLVLTDPLFFNNHVLMNVLSNAIKFSPRGATIKLAIRHIGRKVALIVEDHGIGMERSALKNLFVESYNKSRPGTDGESGSGFGMLILKSFMDRFGGKVWVDSKIGKNSGTKVTLLFKNADLVGELQGYDLGFCDLVMKGVETEETNNVAGAKEYSGNEFSNNFSQENPARA